ncbi:PucR family transcriptional regulator [Pseudomonas sp. DR48]|uniref:PucR family transcriptional regulator n=1 Tax=Pseudomonas sp. DR48 TaxID=2871095 RepID=UPI0021BD5B18|nr:helix-turn-helix domain-containing protein [Pseudomonas sp. DR48]
MLGALADYDLQQGGQLQHTLRVFLEQNRAWQKSAQRLNVHKQTLVYRIRRIEEITGRSLDLTEDVAILRIAFRSAEIAGISGVSE